MWVFGSNFALKQESKANVPFEANLSTLANNEWQMEG